MKTRSGFVSNSSSSSFVILGVAYSMDSPDYKKDVNSSFVPGMDIRHDYETRVTYVGSIIAEGEYFSNRSISLNDFVVKGNKVIEATGKEPSIYIGTRGC